MRDFTESDVVSIVQPAAEAYTQRLITVDFLYLDNERCDRCKGTEEALETAIKQVEPILEPLNVGLIVRDIHVSTLSAAEATQLAVSPTIRIDGRDIQPDYIENTCESCGNRCAGEGTVDCRLWEYQGETYTVAPVALLVEALVRTIAPNQPESDSSRESQDYQISPNVRDFFTDSEDGVSESGCGC